VRLRRLERELGGRIEIVWKSYLLRPTPDGSRDMEKFRAYTQGWARPAAEPDAGTFRPWQTDAPPPSHSLPPQLVARAAAALDRAAFESMHERLFHAYFAENRDITDRATLRTLWEDIGLPEARFELCDDPAVREAVLADHREAIELGVHGVPAVRIEPNLVATVGAHSLDQYRRWFLKQLAALDAGPREE
jgi:predicted DsbA family dithiol-disulfide isomerase